jgi:hypothetical protein
MGQRGCPETSITSYQTKPPNIPPPQKKEGLKFLEVFFDSRLQMKGQGTVPPLQLYSLIFTSHNQNLHLNAVKELTHKHKFKISQSTFNYIGA